MTKPTDRNSMNPTPEGSDVVRIQPTNGEEEVVPYRPPGEDIGFVDYRVGVGESIRWHWPIVVGAVVLFVALAGAVGLVREPNYTAEATLTVSQPGAGAGGLSGFAEASASLAAGYSRAIDATRVVNPVARALDLSASTVRSDVSASPIPASPVIRVRAEAGSASSAVRVANLASASLIEFVDHLSRSDKAASNLLDEFAQASDRVSRQQARLESLENSDSGSAAINNAKAQRDSAKLEAQALSSAYQQIKENQATGTPLQVLSLASQASDDKTSKLELLIFIGLLAGLAVGAALATWRANR